MGIFVTINYSVKTFVCNVIYVMKVIKFKKLYLINTIKLSRHLNFLQFIFKKLNKSNNCKNHTHSLVKNYSINTLMQKKLGMK